MSGELFHFSPSACRVVDEFDYGDKRVAIPKFVGPGLIPYRKQTPRVCLRLKRLQTSKSHFGRSLRYRDHASIAYRLRRTRVP